jgi:hypothetical protein
MMGFANPHSRLAARTSSQRCVPSMQNSLNSFKTKFSRIPERLDCRRLMQLLTAFHHHRRRWQTPKSIYANTKRYSISIIPTGITATAAKRLRLPSRPLIETASDQL